MSKLLTFDLIKTIMPCVEDEGMIDQIASSQQPSYLISTVAIHEPFAIHSQWTSLSNIGDEFCLRITFSGEIENSEF